MEYKLITIEQILESAGAPVKKKYRQIFEQKTEQKQDDEKQEKEQEKVVKKLEGLVKHKMKGVGGKVYSDYIQTGDLGQKFGIALRKITVDEYGGAHGLTYKTGYQVIDLATKKVIYGFGPCTYRGGHPSDMDDWSIAYYTAKILREKKGSAVIGLESREKLLIKEVKKDGTSQTLESYDLEAEEKTREKTESAGKAVKDLDGECIDTLLEAEYGKESCTVHSEKLSDELVLSKISYYGRPYDGRVRGAGMCLTVKDKGIIELGGISLATYHPGSRFITVDASMKDVKLRKTKDKAVITGKIEAYESPLEWWQTKKIQDTEKFKYEIDLKKLI